MNLKRGHTHSYIAIGIGETHLHVKHAKSRGSGGMPPGNFEKLALPKLNLESIFSDLAELQIQQNFLKLHKIYLAI